MELSGQLHAPADLSLETDYKVAQHIKLPYIISNNVPTDGISDGAAQLMERPR
jgi:hypothetical protein